MPHAVPHYSQHIDVPLPAWRNRACGIVALKAVMDFWNARNITPATPQEILALIRSGESSGAYLPDIGWLHAGIVRLAKAHGFIAENHDWAKTNTEIAFYSLRPLLAKGPVIASIHKNLNRKNGGHLVVLTHATNRHVFYNDPDSRTRKDIPRRTTVAEFREGWKRRIITLSPKKLPNKTRVGKV